MLWEKSKKGTKRPPLRILMLQGLYSEFWAFWLLLLGLGCPTSPQNPWSAQQSRLSPGNPQSVPGVPSPRVSSQIHCLQGGNVRRIKVCLAGFRHIACGLYQGFRWRELAEFWALAEEEQVFTDVEVTPSVENKNPGLSRSSDRTGPRAGKPKRYELKSSCSALRAAPSRTFGISLGGSPKQSCERLP